MMVIVGKKVIMEEMFDTHPVVMQPEEALLYSNRTPMNWFARFNDSNWSLDCENTPMDHFGYIQFITLGCVLGAIGLVGILANILSIIVFTKMPQRSSTTFLIQTLAIADSAFLFFNLMFWSVIGWYNALGKVCYYVKHFSAIVPYISGLMEISRDLAVWMVAVVSADRYVAIYYPLSMNKICRVSIAVRIIIGLLLYVIAFNIPIFLQYQYGEIQGEGSDTLPSFSYGNTFTSTFTYNLTYYTIDSIANLLVPMLMVLTMNVRIVLVLKRARSRRAILSRNADTDRGSYATIMLVFIAVIFIICSMPKVVQSIYIIWEALQSDRADDTFALTIISTLMQGINSFINFWIYCLTGKKFRIVLKNMFRCLKCREIVYVCSRGKYEDESEF